MATKQPYSYRLVPQEKEYKLWAVMKKAAEEYHYHSPVQADHKYRVTIKDQDGIVQMEEDIAIQGEEKEHNRRLRKFLARL